MARQINFEVQINQGGRWTIHARFPSTGREEAIEEAKQIGGLGSVRVLRDEYNSETGTSSEYTIYKSGEGGTSYSPGPSSSGASAGGGGASSYDDDDDDYEGSDDAWMSGEHEEEFLYDDDEDEGRKKKKDPNATGFTGLIVKLLFIILLAVGLAGSVVAVLSPYIDGINVFGVRMKGAAKENTLILTFLLTFLSTAIMLSTVLLRKTSLKERKRSPKSGRPVTRAAARPAAAQKKKTQPAKSASQETAIPPIPTETAKASSGEDAETKEVPPIPDTDSMAEFREAASAEASSGDTSEAPTPTEMASDEESDESKRGVVLSAEDYPMAGEQGADMLSPHAEKQKKYMMGFIEKAMSAAGQDQKSMSNFDKFGISLFLAGACESLGQKHELSDSEVAKIMADSVQTMGFKRSHATTFADKYDEYLVQDPTYMQMFQAGRNSLSTYLTDESRIEQNMVTAMTEWNKPKAKEAEAGPVTVLFTDIAGSTAMTQNLGDAGAQQVVRAHNRVVREALTMWNGKEIKHTGDGIMASFVKTSDSLDAAMQMQREANEHTAQNPDKPLRLKIGINAGEPISEDNDLFGSTVQMSARIVDKAQADEIFVSEIVRGICAGKSYKFKNRGTYPMKGFETDPVLYEVVWREEEEAE